ncbi:MAG: cytidylate kinase family protein [Candidatus Aenigmarchaeota archaeon]|nr:cytidylate kinase family protein [Candidatus Aenigmarchaeota archaeon]
MKKTVLVISGPPGAGSTTISKEIAKRLKLDFFSPGFLQKSLAKGLNQSEAAIKVWKTEKGRSKEFHSDLDGLQTEIAKKGNVVMCGKLSIHFLKKYATFSVWLDVPIDVRARRTAERDGMTFEQAKKDVSERERIEREEWKKMYGFDYFDQKKEADLILDSSNMSTDETVNVILEKIK